MYWSRVSLISCGVGTLWRVSPASRSSSSARISLQRVMHSLQMYTDGPEMNFRTESLLLPQKEQRRCLSLDIAFTAEEPGPGTPILCVPVPEWSRHRLHLSHGLAGCEDGVDQAVFLRFLRAHEPVTVHVALDLLHRLAGVLRVQLVHLAAQVEDLPRLDLDVGR